MESGRPQREQAVVRGPGRGGPGSDAGSVSLELLGSLPVIALGLLVTVQLVFAGYALWSAGLAARAGARSVLTGKGPEGAARRALPPGIADQIRVERADGVTVAVSVPRILPGLPRFEVSSSSDLGAPAGR
jgi:hypothetical protein